MLNSICSCIIFLLHNTALDTVQDTYLQVSWKASTVIPILKTSKLRHRKVDQLASHLAFIQSLLGVLMLSLANFLFWNSSFSFAANASPVLLECPTAFKQQCNLPSMASAGGWQEGMNHSFPRKSFTIFRRDVSTSHTVSENDSIQEGKRDM